MTLLERLGLRQPAVRITASGAVVPSPRVVDPARLPIASPWVNSDLQRIVFNDIFGGSLPENTRSGAMRLPAIARGRNLIVTSISRNPLRQYAGAADAPTQSPWLYRTDQPTSPQQRLAWTVDDLIFYGWSCWWRDNDPATGYPLHYTRVEQEDWQINDDNRVEVNGEEVGDTDVTLIPGLHEGILTFGSEVLEDARSLYRIVRARLINPIPQLELHQTGGAQLTDDEIDALIARWAAARSGQNGGVGYTNSSIELNEHGGGDENLMIEARNAATMDLARLIGVHGGMLDGTTPTASLNYETTTGRNQEFADFDLALYTLPITARLSLDDVVPPGERVGFDMSDFYSLTPSPSGTPTDD